MGGRDCRVSVDLMGTRCRVSSAAAVDRSDLCYHRRSGGDSDYVERQWQNDPLCWCCGIPRMWQNSAGTIVAGASLGFGDNGPAA